MHRSLESRFGYPTIGRSGLVVLWTAPFRAQKSGNTPKGPRFLASFVTSSPFVGKWWRAMPCAIRGPLAASMPCSLLLCLMTDAAQAREHESGPQPTMRIPVESLGYRPPGKLYLLARYSSSSLDFLDSTHLLLTFRQPRLLLREQGSDGLDQVIQADVLELPTGKVVAQDQWLLHDRGRYLWRLADDKVMLRIGSSLYETDSKLHLKPLLSVTDGTGGGRDLTRWKAAGGGERARETYAGGARASWRRTLRSVGATPPARMCRYA